MKSVGRPAAVLWDLGGVLVSIDWPAAVTHWERRLGLHDGDLLRCLFGGNDSSVLVGRVPEDEWWRIVGHRIGAPWHEVRELRADLGRREVLDRRLLQIIRHLRPVAKHAIVSNAWGGTRQRLRARGVDRLFDQIVISAEVGAAKPAPAIYRAAWERLGLSPSNCVLIDDAIENVEAATALGMIGYLHQSSVQTATWLRGLLGDGR